MMKSLLHLCLIVAICLSIPAAAAESTILLKYGAFSPASGEPDVPPELRATTGDPVRLVHVARPLTSVEVGSLEQTGASILGYLPQFTYIVRAAPDALQRLNALPLVHWTGPFHPSYKIQTGLLDCDEDLVEINISLFPEMHQLESGRSFDKRLVDLGGTMILDERDLIGAARVKVSPSAISALAALPAVRWIDRYHPPQRYMNHIRTGMGVEEAAIGGFSGQGIAGEVKEGGFDSGHQDFGNLIAIDGSPGVDPHGTCTFGIVFGDGSGNPMATGMMPEGDGIFCDWAIGRYASVSNLRTNWDGVFQSCSWGTGGNNGEYTNDSRQDDQAVNDFEVSMLYAAGNGGVNPVTISTDSAAKNVIAVGGIYHQDTATLDDDQWEQHGGGATPAQGPAADGRIKPDLVAAFDWIQTVDWTGEDGYSPGDYYDNFGGTSGATPIVAGAVGLTCQMFKENHFGNNPAGVLPGAATVKALLIANAHQYSLDASERLKQGWGLAHVGRMHEAGVRQLIIDGDIPLETGQVWSTAVTRYSAGESLKISLVWNDEPGEASSTLALINDLDLTVTAPDGSVYRGNHGLMESLWSAPQGTPDRLNNVENVFIQSPLDGLYFIQVNAFNVAMDNNAAEGMNQAFSLVASMADPHSQVPLESLVTGPGPHEDNPPLLRTWDPAGGGGFTAEWRAYGIDRYGVNVVCGDLDGSGIDSVITGAGPGAVFGPHVRGFQPDGTPLPGVNFIAYGTNRYGVNVSTGDIDGDGMDEIITGAGPGAVFGPHVRGWNVDGGAASPMNGVSFFAYGTPKWGVNVAAGDIDGDGFDEIVTGAGPGTVYGPHVRSWDHDGGSGTLPDPAVSFFAYGTLMWGVNVACGDIDGDGIDEIITGPGPGSVFGPHIRGWNYDGDSVAALPGVSFMAYPDASHGAAVGTADVDGDGVDEIITMPGPDITWEARVRAWDVDNGTAAHLGAIDFPAYEGMGFTGGGRIAGGALHSR